MVATRSQVVVVAVVSLLLASRDAGATPAGHHTVNAAIGDASWVAEHGRLPDATAGEVTRIRTHLRYVLDRLRRRDVSRLSVAQRAKRRAALDSLERYSARGVFPRRSGDGYPGRRPRFIDDAGTYCAVGHLIAASGAPELARAINAKYEYAYVPQIRSPRLLRWARATGFTVRELAMIQPAYGFVYPTEESTRRAIERDKEVITVACAKKHRPLQKVHLRANSRQPRGQIVSTTSADPFAQCFAKLASQAAWTRSGGSRRRDFRFQIAVPIPNVQRIFAKSARMLDLPTGTICLPRPGAIPKRASVHLATSSKGLVVMVDTWPRNAEVNACLKSHVRSRMVAFGPGSWRLRTRLMTPLPPLMTSQNLQRVVDGNAPRLAGDCHSKEDPPLPMSVSVVARRDAEEFAIEVKARNEAFEACLRRKLQKSLKHNFERYRRLPNGNPQRYFRIDGDAQASHSFTVDHRR